MAHPQQNHHQHHVDPRRPAAAAGPLHSASIAFFLLRRNCLLHNRLLILFAGCSPAFLRWFAGLCSRSQSPGLRPGALPCLLSRFLRPLRCRRLLRLLHLLPASIRQINILLIHVLQDPLRPAVELPLRRLGLLDQPVHRVGVGDDREKRPQVSMLGMGDHRPDGLAQQARAFFPRVGRKVGPQPLFGAHVRLRAAIGGRSGDAQQRAHLAISLPPDTQSKRLLAENIFPLRSHLRLRHVGVSLHMDRIHMRQIGHFVRIVRGAKWLSHGNCPSSIRKHSNSTRTARISGKVRNANQR